MNNQLKMLLVHLKLDNVKVVMNVDGERLILGRNKIYKSTKEDGTVQLVVINNLNYKVTFITEQEIVDSFDGAYSNVKEIMQDHVSRGYTN